jgi:hypothetical protein
MKMGHKIGSVLVGCVLLLAVQSVSAATFGFDRITSNASVDPSSQFTVTVTDPGSGNVAFTFRNNVGIASSITEIYFQDGFLGAPTITESAGVSYETGASPQALPGATGATPRFLTSRMFDSQSTAPQTDQNGINAAGEFLTLTFGLGSYASVAAVINSLENPNNGVLRIALHVQSIGPNGASDSFVDTPTPVGVPPVPDGGSTVALMGLAMVGIGSIRGSFSRN